MIYYQNEDVCIRDLEEADAQIITDEEIAQGWHQSIDKYLMRLQHQAQGKAICLVAEYQGHVAGYVNVYPTVITGPFLGRGYPEIVDFGVLVKYRRRGIGTKLMDAAGLTAVDMSDYGKVKITYLADTGYTLDGGILKFAVLRDDAVYPSSKNSLGLTTYGAWQTQTLFFSSIAGEVNGPVKAFSVMNANGAVQGDVIYIASIEFIK